MIQQVLKAIMGSRMMNSNALFSSVLQRKQMHMEGRGGSWMMRACDKLDCFVESNH